VTALSIFRTWRSRPRHIQHQLAGGLFETGFSSLCNCTKCLRIVDSNIGEDLAVDFDFGTIESIDETAVGQPMQAGRCVDSCDPERTKLAVLNNLLRAP
jgi:hypothetical protein